MKKEIIYRTGYNNHKFFFIRLLVADSSLDRKEIEYIFKLPSECNFVYDSEIEPLWQRTTWIKGSMDFFKEAGAIAKWLHASLNAYPEMKKSVNLLKMLIGLCGTDYIKSTLELEIADIISDLELDVSVEIFPGLIFGNMDLKSASRPRPETQDASWVRT